MPREGDWHRVADAAVLQIVPTGRGRVRCAPARRSTWSSDRLF